LSIPVFSVVAWSGTGKTTLLEKLVPELKSRGLRVAVIKHDAHEFEVDKAGKDSWRMTRAGADVVAIASSTHAAVMENRPVAFEALVRRIEGVDVILTEGYKTGDYPKIALRRGDRGYAVEPSDCLALMSDTPAESGAAELSLDDVCGLADIIAREICKK
jgi:molybdopterin-guanine dinucleotide biosynthesis protein MobB